MFAALVDDTAMSEHAVKHGNEEQGQDGGECQTAYHGCTHGAPHFGALSVPTAIGTIPRMVVRVVMTTGRRRDSPPRITARRIDMPRSRLSDM